MWFLKFLTLISIVTLYASKGYPANAGPYLAVNSREDLLKSQSKRLKGSLDLNAVTIEGISLASSTLEDAIKKFGKSAINVDDDSSFVCFKGYDDTLIRFNSGIMSLKDHGILSIDLHSANEKVSYLKSCINSDKVSSKIRLKNGIGLLITPSEITKRMKKPSYSGSKLIVYRYDETGKDEGRETETSSGIEFYINNDKVTRISLYSITSY